MVAPKRVAIYARVSTVDKGQDPETQLRALREYAARRGFGPAGEYIDYASGTRDDRPQYQALLAAARKRQIEVVLVWRYDRFARSTQALVHALHEFQQNPRSLRWKSHRRKTPYRHFCAPRLQVFSPQIYQELLFIAWVWTLSPLRKTLTPPRHKGS